MRFFDDKESSCARYPNFNIEDWLITNGLEYKINSATDHREISINCPKCHERGKTYDVNKKLWINESTGMFTCYRCNFLGSLPRLMGVLAKTTFDGALKILRGDLLDPLDHLNLTLYNEKIDLSDDVDELKEIEMPYGYQVIDGPHPYLEKRDIPWEYAARNDWGVGKAGFVENRIIVPIFMEDRLVFWQARASWEEPENKAFKKVLNPKGVSARSVLYNYDVAKHHETIIIVEGFTDAVKAGPNTVATNGKRLHAMQVDWLLKTKAKKIVLMWDRDAWTDHKLNKKTGLMIDPCSMQKATELLRIASFDVVLARMPEGRDPGSFPYKSKELADIVKTAKPLEYYIKRGIIK